MDWLEIVLYVLLMVVGGGGIFSLIIRSRLEELRAIEERLSLERRKVYGGILRLEIRRSLGNKKTKLNEFDMLRGEITDIDKFLDKSNS